MKIAIYLVLSIMILSVAGPVWALDEYKQFRKGTWDFDFGTDYFKTDANYTSEGGSYQKLPEGNYYQLMNFYFASHYDFNKTSSIYGKVNVGNAESQGLDAKRSNSTLNEVSLGYTAVMYSDSFDLLADLGFVYPLADISSDTDTVMSTEGVMEFIGLLRLQMTMSSMRTYGYIGGDYRESRSALLPWGVGLEWKGSYILLGAKIFGYQSITDDKDSDAYNKNQRLIVSDRVNGGSLKFYGVNPDLVDSQIYTNFKLHKDITMEINGGMTLTGAASAAGYHVGAIFRYTWDTEPSYYLKPTLPEDNLSSERKLPRFQEETDDGVNQKLFDKKGYPKQKKQ